MSQGFTKDPNYALETGGNLATIAGDTTSIDGKILKCDTDSVILTGPLGQAAMASSIPVAISSDQSAVPISATSLPLPSGAATSANQSDELSYLSILVSDSAIMADWDNAASDGASISGDTAHDIVDSGEPVKIGGKALTGDSSAVSNGDRVNAWFDEYGQLQVARKAKVCSPDTPTNIITTYNAVTTSARSSAITRHPGCLMADILIDLSVSGTPTDIRLYIEGIEGGGYHPYTVGWQGLWIYDDQVIGSGFKETVTVRLPATSTFDVYVVANGTDASNTFTINDMDIYQRSGY